ncbi:MAG: ABC transporter substrate-binding protein [Deltaproteobacteria bacterium]|nr:ABC transporter substrate-binding protein [Deltaproteobacteria bacterium]
MVDLKRLAVFLILAVAFVSTATARKAWPQAPAKSERVRIGYPSRGLTVLPLRVAQVKGFFKEEGLEPEIIQMRAGVTVTALMTGDIEFGSALDSLVRAAARGQPLKGLLSFVNKPMHYLVSRSEFNSVRDLRGKTLAISSFGSTEQNTTHAILKAHGLDPDKKDVLVVALGDSPVRLEALKRGIVDATVILIPHVIVAGNLGFRILAHAGDYIELSTPGLGTSDKLLRERPDQIKRTVRAALKALLFVRQNRDESIRIAKDWLALDDDTAGKAYDMGIKSYSEDGSPSEKGLLTSIQLSGVKKDIPLTQVFDLGILREVQKELKR